MGTHIHTESQHARRHSARPQGQGPALLWTMYCRLLTPKPKPEPERSQYRGSKSLFPDPECYIQPSKCQMCLLALSSSVSHQEPSRLCTLMENSRWPEFTAPLGDSDPKEGSSEESWYTSSCKSRKSAFNLNHTHSHLLFQMRKDPLEQYSNAPLCSLPLASHL